MIELSGPLPDILHSRIRRSIKAAESSEGQDFAQACAERVAKGDTGAYFAPAVRLVVDATLGVANHPNFAPRLSSEMIDRQLGISTVAKTITKYCIDEGEFTRLYSDHVLSSAQVSDNDRAHLQHQPYMEKLTSGPFNDTRWVAGGALLLLKEADVEDPRAVIQRSTSLTAVSAIAPSKNFENAVRYFGEIYFDPEHLLLLDGPEPKVTFTPEARHKIADWSEKGRGCPAGRISDPNHKTTLLAYWSQAVEVLMPDDVTLNDM